MIMFSTSQRGVTSGGAATFQAHKLSKNMKLDEVFQFKLKDGTFPLNKEIEIGVFGDDPIYLSIEKSKSG